MTESVEQSPYNEDWLLRRMSEHLRERLEDHFADIFISATIDALDINIRGLCALAIDSIAGVTDEVREITNEDVRKLAEKGLDRMVFGYLQTGEIVKA